MTHQFTTPFSGYDIHYNIGSAQRGTAFLIRTTLIATNISRLPLGRPMAMSFGGIYFVNIYAPSGTSKRLERETFFNNDLPYLRETFCWAANLIALDAGYSTGHGSYSRSLSTLIHGYSLRDAWQTRPDNTTYTHYIAHGATRLDRLYPREGLLRRKTGVATVATAFRDHLEVVLRLSMSVTLLRRGRGTWKLESDTLTSTQAMQDLHHHCPQWKNIICIQT